MSALLPPSTPAWPPALDQPLPVEVTGSALSRLGAYRRWPVFSPAWVRGRLRVWGSVLAGLYGLVALATLQASPAVPPWGLLAELGVELLLPLLLGPLAAAWVRRRQWPARQEWWALLAVMAGTVALLLLFRSVMAEPMKQWLAERTGTVDAQGKRKRVTLMLGFSLQTPDEPATEPATPQNAAAGEPMSPPERERGALAGTLLIGALGFWLAGGAGLWAWRSQQRALAQLQQARALAQAQAQRREAELQLSVLAAQVEPHFLFNTLAGVRGAVLADPARATEMIDHLVAYLRAAIPQLRSDGSAQATLGGQLDIVRAYLGLMAARMTRLAWRVEVDPALLGRPCPPLMLISLVENAVKHGIEPKPGPALITLTAQLDAQDQLHITVADDGVGFGAAPGGSGLGLTNIRQRLQQLHQGRAALTLKARPGGGVAATLSLPPA